MTPSPFTTHSCKMLPIQLSTSIVTASFAMRRIPAGAACRPTSWMPALLVFLAALSLRLHDLLHRRHGLSYLYSYMAQTSHQFLALIHRFTSSFSLRRALRSARAFLFMLNGCLFVPPSHVARAMMLGSLLRVWLAHVNCIPSSASFSWGSFWTHACGIVTATASVPPSPLSAALRVYCHLHRWDEHAIHDKLPPRQQISKRSLDADGGTHLVLYFSP